MKKAFADMARSLGLMAVVLGVVLFIGARYLLDPSSADRMPAADYSSVLQAFGDEARQPAFAPHGLPANWRANATRLVNPAAGVVQMHVGWAVPGSRYAGLDESDGADEAVVDAVLGQAGRAVRGQADIDGVAWEVRTSNRGETAFTRTAGRVFVLVTGNATNAELRTLAGSLR